MTFPQQQTPLTLNFSYAALLAEAISPNADEKSGRKQFFRVSDEQFLTAGSQDYGLVMRKGLL